LFFLGAGLVIIFLIHRINYTRFARFAVVLFLLSVPLLLYTLLFGSNINQANRWITLPVLNITFQTSDLAKLAIFTFLARQLSRNQHVIKDFKKGFLPVLVPVLLVCGLIAPANLSTALLLGATCCILFFIGRVAGKHIALLAGVGIIGVFSIFFISKTLNIGRGATWQKRIENFIGTGATEKDADSNYQITQAKIAIANGKLTGLGPGNSQTRDFLPESFSDFIFSIIIEEYGLLGGIVIVGLYLLFLWRSILIFQRCPYAFGAFLAVGLSFTLVFQALINMAVNVGLVPVTGLTLPLVSMGGSSIWFNSIAIGIILSVSRYVDEMEGASFNLNTAQH
jgi:cell division protein FtsW